MNARDDNFGVLVAKKWYERVTELIIIADFNSSTQFSSPATKWVIDLLDRALPERRGASQARRLSVVFDFECEDDR